MRSNGIPKPTRATNLPKEKSHAHPSAPDKVQADAHFLLQRWNLRFMRAFPWEPSLLRNPCHRRLPVTPEPTGCVSGFGTGWGTVRCGF